MARGEVGDPVDPAHGLNVIGRTGTVHVTRRRQVRLFDLVSTTGKARKNKLGMSQEWGHLRCQDDHNNFQNFTK